MKGSVLISLFVAPLLSHAEFVDVDEGGHHHHHHKHHHKHKQVPAAAGAAAVPPATPPAGGVVLNASATQAAQPSGLATTAAPVVERTAGKVEVNGPLPVDFSERFTQAVCNVMSCQQGQVVVTQTYPVPGDDSIVEVTFDAPEAVTLGVEQQVADPESRLANGPLHDFLVAKESAAASAAPAEPAAPAGADQVLPHQVDIDAKMPYGDLEPFGREDTAQELTERSVSESDSMVDQLERAEVAEEKRAVFRALTRLRGAAISSFDGVARSQTGNIDEYNKVHRWRNSHPLQHLADEESDVSKWAFPSNADF